MGSFSVLASVPISSVVSSTATENEYPAWVIGTTYAIGDRCISTVTHRIYESVKESNTGKDPTDVANQSGTTAYWLDIGPTNRWAMFDSEVSTQTEIASPLTVVLRPGAFNAVYLCGLDAEAIEMTVQDEPGGNVTFSYSGTLEGSAPADYWEYFFERFRPQVDFIASGIEEYNAAEITITLTRSSGLVKCGVLAVGDLRPLGKTQRGAKAKPKSYSYIKTDDFGNTSIKRRKKATDMSATVVVDLSEANTVLQTVRDMLDVPCVWIGTGLPEYGGLRVFGLGSGEMSYEPPVAILTLDIQGMI